MSSLQAKVDQLVLHDPAMGVIVSSVGAGAGGQTANNGQMYITLKPWDERSDTVTQVIARLGQKMEAVSAIRLFLQPAQDVSVGVRLCRTLYQYTLQDANSNEMNEWSPRILAILNQIPVLTDVTSDQENSGTAENLTYDRDQASRFGIQPAAIDDVLYDAFGQREVAQYFTGNKAYYVILEVLPVQPLAVNHQSQFPSTTVSFNLNGNASLGDAVARVQIMQASMGVQLSVQGNFQGTAQAFQPSLSSEPYLIPAALAAVYIILGVLYESYVPPLTILSTLPSTGVGALLMLMLFHYQLTVIGLRGIILLIAIVKKNGIMWWTSPSPRSGATE
jgi:multidrug efflux pump subunit AcrB